jgi:hypothetical protein
MSTTALDIATILLALNKLEEIANLTGWEGINQEQEMIFSWLEKHRACLKNITGLNVEVPRSSREMNKNLSDKGFSPGIKPFNPAVSYGVIAVLDKLIKWLNGPADEAEINVADKIYPGFELPEKGVNVYNVDGFPQAHLLELFTKSSDKLWLFVEDGGSVKSFSGLDLPVLSFEVMAAEREIATKDDQLFKLSGFSSQAFSGAIIPKIDFDIKPDINFIVGASLGNGAPGVDQAIQQFKFRMDQYGARIKAVTAMVYMAFSAGDSSPPFIVDKPFYGWFTQRDVNLPMGAFFADYDSWREPAGSLENL